MNKVRTLFRYLLTRKKFTNRQRLERLQRRAMKKQVKFVRKRSPFYRRHWHGYPDHEWSNFPMVNKSVMMNNLSDLLTVKLDLDEAKMVANQAEKSRDFTSKIGKYTIGYSSGTSGSRGMHIVSDKEQAIWAGFMLARGLDNSIFSSNRIGLILRANSNTYESVGSSRIEFKFYDLIRPLKEIHEAILQDELDILMGPPSVLSYFVDIKSAIKVRKMVSVAEVLEEVDRQKIEQYFGLTLHQFYSSTEGEIAATCENGTLHLNEDLMVIQQEWVDQSKGWFYPIISDFYRKTQPIIRYRLNDILVASPTPCGCGDKRQAISAVMGRQDDQFLLLTANGDTEAIVPDLIRRAIMSMSEAITEYIAIQHSPNNIELQLKPNDLENLSMQAFDLLWQTKEVIPPTITVKNYTHVPSVTKLRRIRRNF